MATKQFFFVLGLPRSRTAWLSVLLTGRDSFCFHEGTGAFADWSDYVAALRSRPEAHVGDSNPALIEHIDALLEEFPDARFIVIRRDPAESLEAFCAASPQDAEMLRAGWHEYLNRFEAAVKKLPPYIEVHYTDLRLMIACNAIHSHATGAPLDYGRWKQLRDLHITSRFPAVQREPAKPLEVTVNVEGFDFDDLAARAYTPADRTMIGDWWAHHKEAPMGEYRLPPLGLVIEDEQGPAAALWCYETYGTGVAWIALPVTRPGTSYERACTVLAFAIMAVTQLAGKGYTPPAQFTCFRVIAPQSMGRLLKRIGFTEQPDRSNFFLSL